MGWGKGKTTSAIGITLRALYNKECVMFVQFLKDGQDSGLEFLNDLAEGNLYKIGSFIHLAQGTQGFTKENCLAFWKAVIEAIDIYQPDLIIFDELNVALDYDLFTPYTQEQMLTWLKTISANIDLYITGRINNHKLRHKMIEISDIVSNCYCESHNFNPKCKNCGMEFMENYTYCPVCGEKLTKRINGKKGREC